MTEWTPTTEDVRAGFSRGAIFELEDIRKARFDRWLEAVKREAMAEALEKFAEKWAVQDGIEVLMFARDDVSAVQLTETALIARAAEYRKTTEAGGPHG